MKLALDWANKHGEIVFAGGGIAAVEGMNNWVLALREALAKPDFWEGYEPEPTRPAPMTTDRALDLALEALELNNNKWKSLADSGDCGYWNAEDQDHYKQTNEAITAIKQARALDKKAENARELGLDYEPAQQDPPCKTGSQCTSKCQQCAVQEPVAWISHNAGLYHFKPDESLDPLPLYLAPPAQPALVEPVAYAVYHRMGGGKSLHWREQHSPDGDASEYQLVPLYTTPPAQPAPVQEPVAWVCYGEPGKRDIDFEEADINKLPIGTQLYTTPPAAQRTWEEWFKWWRTSKVADSTEAEIDFADFMLIVRAVESEYGIKENT